MKEHIEWKIGIFCIVGMIAFAFLLGFLDNMDQRQYCKAKIEAGQECLTQLEQAEYRKNIAEEGRQYRKRIKEEEYQKRENLEKGRTCR